MNKLEQLINELCPEGVEYKALGELGEFYSGLSGKSKDDFSNGNAKFITYMNVFSNLSLKIDVDDKVKIGENENQNTIQYGDVLFTGSSETPEECGMSSVLTSITNEKLYLNSFCFGFRFYNKNLIIPKFSKYVFRASELRKQIKRTASGVTRFNVSKKKMEKVTIPIPPLPVQEEIVRILDKFTELTTELTAELTARKQQYEYYRDIIFANYKSAPKKKLIEVADISRGIRVVKKQLISNGNYPVYQNSLAPMGYYDKYNCNKNTTYVISAGAAGEIGYCETNFWAADDCLFFSNLREVNNKYIYYFLLTKQDFIYSNVRKASIPRLSRTVIENLQIPIISIDEQQRIVDILDRFDKLCNDISEGLPAEIEARQKQYEYYRDELLTFKKKEATKNE